MKKFLLIFIIIILTLPAAIALEVDVDEIKTDKRINFNNYQGKQGKRETAREIRAIGYGLSRGIKRTGTRFIYHGKYSVRRAISDREPDKYSSDIFYIDRNARVDHIKNVRRIISAYLQGMYNYTRTEGDTVALFLTYYNAIHRSDIKYFSSKYKTVVMKNVNSRNAGIATSYNLWPGKTAMLIPLTKDAKRGSIKKIDPFIISGKDVRKEVRKDDSNIETRKKMTELKEDELNKEKKKIADENRRIEKEKERLSKEKKKVQDRKKIIEDKKSEIRKKKEELKEEKKKAEKIDDPEKRKKKQDELKKEEENLKKSEEKIKKEDKDLKKEVEKISKKEKTIEKDKKKIDEEKKELKKKDEDLKEDKKEIEEDQELKPLDNKELKKKKQELKKKEEELDKREDRLKTKETDKKIFGLKFYYLKVKEYLEGGHYNNEMYMINAKTRKIEFKSPVTNICGRRYDIFSGGIVVITHRGNHVKGHRLTTLDRKTLKEVKSGSDDVFWRSFIEIRDDNIYVIIRKKNRNYLGRFDKELKLAASSKEEINENSFITFFEDYIYINRKDMSIMVLKKEDLSFVDIIKP